MRVHNLLLAGLLLIFAASCSSDDINGDKPGEVDGVKAYLSLNLVSDNPLNTRTEGNTTLPEPEPEVSGDRQIGEVAVLLTNEDGGIVQVYTTATVNKNSTGTTEPFSVKIGKYYAYAIANPMAEVKTVVEASKGKNIQQVITLIDAAAGTADQYATASKFTMMNFNKNDITTKGGVFVEITTANNSPEKAQTVTIPVDRFVARIRISDKSLLNIDELKKLAFIDTKEPIFDAIELNKQYLIYGARKANLIQEWTNYTYPSTPAPKVGIVLNNPTVTNNTDFYNRLDKIAEYDPNDPNNMINTTLKDTDFKDIVYALENRPEILPVKDATQGDKLISYTSRIGETTGTIFKVQTKKGASNVATFYRYKGYFYSNLTNVLAAYNKDNVGNEISETPAPTAEVLRTAGIRVYENGVMYYTYWVKDENYKLENNLYNVVHRNSVYNLYIDKLNKMGGDLPGTDIDPDPIKPIEELAYLKVTVEVKPWVISNNHIEL